MQKCPICGTSLIGRDFYEETHLSEAYWRCSHDHYWYEFSYGTTIVTIGTKVLSEYYSDSDKKKTEFRRDCEKAVFQYQQRYKSELVALLV